MAENYKQMYENAMMMLGKYQDVIVPGLREQLEKRVEVVRCKDCKHLWKKNMLCVHPKRMHGMVAICDCDKDDFCSYGERKTP